MFRIAALAAALTAVLTVPSARAEGPLEAIARHVPKNAEGEIYLVDLAAAARQAAAFPVGDAGTAELMRWTAAMPPPGFDRGVLLLSDNGFRGELGFSIHDIAQMVGWGRPPSLPVVMRSEALDGDRIAAALAARGFATATDRRVPVWHRQDDFRIDPARRAEEPFHGAIGVSERFALDGDTLFFARDWPAMDVLLAGGASLMDDPDAAAILAAAAAQDGNGDLLDMVMLDPPVGLADADDPILPPNMPEEARAMFLDRYHAAGPRLPGYPRYALALWQRGDWMTGAILIPYPAPAIAQEAMARFTRRVDTVPSLVTGTSFAGLLPEHRDFRIFEAEGRAVLVLAFGQQVDTSGKIGLTTFARNPRARLLNMAYTRDIDLLLEPETAR